MEIDIRDFNEHIQAVFCLYGLGWKRQYYQTVNAYIDPLTGEVIELSMGRKIWL
jgi:hypothetical protein